MIRIDKLISNNTNYSRKEVNKLIKQKRIKLNQTVIDDPGFKVCEHETNIYIDENKINVNNQIYLVLNKPKNYICSNVDNDGLSVLNLIEEINYKNIHIIGRLDKDTTGLVLITNDGQFSHQIKSPKNKIEKEYEVTLEKNINQKDIDYLMNTKIIFDNKELKEFQIFNIKDNKLNIVLVEGKYHQIKRLFEIVKNPVIELKRIRIGNLKLNELNLEIGKYKKINKLDIFSKN